MVLRARDVSKKILANCPNGMIFLVLSTFLSFEEYILHWKQEEIKTDFKSISNRDVN